MTTQQFNVKRVIEERKELNGVGEQSITIHMLAMVEIQEQRFGRGDWSLGI